MHERNLRFTSGIPAASKKPKKSRLVMEPPKQGLCKIMSLCLSLPFSLKSKNSLEWAIKMFHATILKQEGTVMPTTEPGI